MSQKYSKGFIFFILKEFYPHDLYLSHNKFRKMRKFQLKLQFCLDNPQDVKFLSVSVMRVFLGCRRRCYCGGGAALKDGGGGSDGEFSVGGHSPEK